MWIFLLFLHGKALELWRAREATSHSAFLPTFMVDLDIVLHGGLLAGSITEVCCFFISDFNMLVVLTFMCLLCNIRICVVVFSYSFRYAAETVAMGIG